MRPRNKSLLNVLFGTGLYLLDSVRDRVVDGVEDLRGRAQLPPIALAGRRGPFAGKATP